MSRFRCVTSGGGTVRSWSWVTPAIWVWGIVLANSWKRPRRLGPGGPVWAFSGGGKRRAEIERFTREHPEARIQLHPYVARERLRESLCAADVHLVSLDSKWQGMMVPSKLASVFAVGKPVIFVGGRHNEIAQWIAESGAGWIVAEDDVDGLLAAVEQAGEKNGANFCVVNWLGVFLKQTLTAK